MVLLALVILLGGFNSPRPPSPPACPLYSIIAQMLL